MKSKYFQKFPPYKNFAVCFAIALFASIGLWMSRGSIAPSASASPDLFDTVWQTVSERFFDPKFNGVDWAALKEQYKPRVSQAPSSTAKADLINEMLGKLRTSHTRFYTPDTPQYYQLLGVFSPRDSQLRSQLRTKFPKGKIEYTDIGIFTTEIEGKTFIKAILDGSPAETAGLQVGDRIVSVDNKPFHPIESFAGKANRPIQMQIQRTSDPASQQQITVTPKLFDGITMFLDAMRDSVEVIERSGKKIGYIHIWSYAGEQYQEKLEEELAFGRLKDADALILDLREGWGGAPPNALHVFTARGPSVTSIGRDGKKFTYTSHWDKPVVMLVNENSRSAKEILAYSFQKYNIGTVVGAQTPGAVVGGRAFLMPDSSLLYVAVADVYVDGNVRLEGVGVTPDIIVPSPIVYAKGTDPQKEKAIAIAVDRVARSDR